MPRSLLMINCKASNLVLRELMFKCSTIILLGEFSLNSSGSEN